METRNILDKHGNQIGQLTLPSGTSEQVWGERMSMLQYDNPVPTIDEILDLKILQYSDFGYSLLAKISRENKLLGITEDEVTELVTKYMEVIQLLMLGSLPTVLTRIQAIGPFGIMSQDRIDGYCSEIKRQLGI